ncbi:MAG: hypothetical protein PVI78_10990 [Anaerolineales bacterium]|jgi:hypothetical protein
MIGIWSSYLHIYLYVVAIAMLIGFGIPLLLVPTRWARLLRWEIPVEKDLAVFLGRSVGVFIIVTAVFAIRAAGMPAVQPFFFDMLLWTVSGSLLIHVYGAIAKAQPITETIEIVVWVLLLLATLAFYPA